MSDEPLAIIGAILIAIAIPDLRTALFIRGVAARHPESVALSAYKVAMDVIALVGATFAIIGLNTTLGILLTEGRTLWPTGAGVILLIAIALILKVPGAYFRDQVNRLAARAEAGEFDEARYAASVLRALGWTVVPPVGVVPDVEVAE